MKNPTFNSETQHAKNIEKQRINALIIVDNGRGGQMEYCGFNSVDQCPTFSKEGSNNHFIFHCWNQYEKAAEMLTALGYTVLDFQLKYERLSHIWNKNN